MWVRQGWKLHTEKKGVRIYKQTASDAAVHMIRAETEIKGSPEDFVGVGLMDTTEKLATMFAKFDPMVNGAEVRCALLSCLALPALSDGGACTYQVLAVIPPDYKPMTLPLVTVKWMRVRMSPLWDRDFVLGEYCDWLQDDDGSWCAVAAVGSVDFPECPETSSAVRGAPLWAVGRTCAFRCANVCPAPPAHTRQLPFRRRNLAHRLRVPSNENPRRDDGPVHRAGRPQGPHPQVPGEQGVGTAGHEPGSRESVRRAASPSDASEGSRPSVLKWRP